MNAELNMHRQQERAVHALRTPCARFPCACRLCCAFSAAAFSIASAARHAPSPTPFARPATKLRLGNGATLNRPGSGHALSSLAKSQHQPIYHLLLSSYARLSIGQTR
eukprot:3339767-Pleurochrysis_carterae.AAC.1